MSKKSGSKTNKEIWKPVPINDFSKNYEVSNTGFVRNKNNKLLSPTMRSGYLSYILKNSGKMKSPKVHRMVALAFIPNDDPENKKVVNHINGNKLDNRVENLEWCSFADNAKHAIDNGLHVHTQREIMMYDQETEKAYIYNSIQAASKDINVHDGTICKVLSGERQSTHGYNFIYIDDDPNKTTDVDFSKFKQVVGFPNYLVNAQGQIYSIPLNKFATLQEHKGGAGMTISLVNLGVIRQFLIHRLVASYFLKKKNDSHNSIHHINGDKTNNNVENLKWTYVPGVEMLESNYNVPYYSPETAVKAPKRKSAANSKPKNLLTANPRNLSKKQREERKKLLEKQSKSKSSGSKTSKSRPSGSKFVKEKSTKKTRQQKLQQLAKL